MFVLTVNLQIKQALTKCEGLFEFFSCFRIFVAIVNEIFCNRNNDPCTFSCFDAFAYWKCHYLVFSDPQ